MKKTDAKGRIASISRDYFDYMAKHYPVMCLNDEFYFFPRAKKGIHFLDSLDSLDAQKIKRDVAHINRCKESLDRLSGEGLDLEARIDITLLRQSMSTFLREFGKTKIWQIDPNLYIKVFLLGIDQLLNRFSFIKRDISDCLISRISQVPRLLQEAKKNLKKVPYTYLDVAMEMVDASRHYFRATDFIPQKQRSLDRRLRSSIEKALEALEDFRMYLMKKSSHLSFIKDRTVLESILKDSFSYRRGLDEIFEIASRSYHETLKQLDHAAKEAKSRKRWQDILSKYALQIKDTGELLDAYSTEIERLKRFFRRSNIITIPKTQRIKVRLTPYFMRPVRASASYSSPVTDNAHEPAYFYVTPDIEGILHSEYKFVTAHETYPGHHLLDAERRRIKNPIRQQIESPLFYEGWASYAECLIDRSGYVKDPKQRLLGLKRQAWRALRAMLDVGIRIKRLKYHDAERMLKGLGYPTHVVKAMLRHYVLSPGYQLCYTIGKFELDRLRDKFAQKCGLKKFHDIILESGQIPFDLLEERLEAKLCSRNS
jgi:uncharacterized protein (DUF885 family)